MKGIVIVVVFGISFFSETIFIKAQSKFEISAKEARTLLSADTSAVLLDVRSPREYSEERISNTPLIPLQFLESKILELERYKQKRIIVYCYSGNRSELAVEILREYGFNAVNMQGGLVQWKVNKFPTISGSKK